MERDAYKLDKNLPSKTSEARIMKDIYFSL